MVKRKSAKEVLAGYSSQQLTEILVEELKAVGIEYTVGSIGHASEFVPLSAEDTISELAFSCSLDLFGAKQFYQ